MQAVQTIDIPDAVAYHDSLAADWDRRYASGGFRRRAALFERKVLPRLALDGRRWVDVGCGSGFFARLLARRGASVLGLDGSPAMIEAARAARGAGGHDRLDFAVVPTVERIDLDDASVDGCLCLSVLEYVIRPERCLAEMARITRPGGQIVISAPDRRSLLRRVQGWRLRLARGLGMVGSSYLDSSHTSWTPRELDALGEAHGLVPAIATGFDPIVPRALWTLCAPSLRFVLWKKPLIEQGSRPE
ncbi:MAG TPA: class I SAM-dependent methyltransferase [Caulobacteraceae bacterium]|nr:class I SAM-dependent methyltransferase [Caulobacteraceae bacterium]